MDSDYFDSVTVISLKRRPERLQTFFSQMQKWPFAIPQLFEAVDGEDLPLIPGYYSPQVWGCTQSHLRVVERAIISKSKRICVFEDDAYFCLDFQKRIVDFLDKVPKNWEVLLLGANNLQGISQVSDGVAKAEYSSGTQAYCLQGRGIVDYYKALAQAHRPDTKGWPDVTFWSNDFQKEHVIYLPFPTMVGQRPGYSDICKEIRPPVW